MSRAERGEPARAGRGVGIARRRCLGGALLALCGAGTPLRAQGAAAAPAERLDKPWRLPARTAIEIDVGAHGGSIAAVLERVAEWAIPLGSRLILRLGAGEHAQPGPVLWSHADGARIAVLGPTGDASRCRLVWRGGGDGFYVGAGQVLGELDGLTLVQTGAAAGPGSGLLADEGGVIRCGSAVAVERFYYGVQARRNGSVRCAGVRCSGGGDANFFAFMGGHLHARGAVAVGARDAARPLGSGFVAEYGGTIDAEGAVARLNALDGFTALSNGAIRAYGARAERNARAGFYADTGGRIVGHDAAAAANCGPGVVTRDGARAVTGERLADAGNGQPPETCRTP